MISHFHRGPRSLQSLLHLWCQRATMAVKFCSAPADLLNFLQSHRDQGPDYLRHVSDLVSTGKHKTVELENPAGATWTIGDLDDTIYRGRPDKVNGWGKFYLPDTVSMRVIGTVKGTSYPRDQLVLMTCEDRQVYGYDGEDMHLVATSLKQLWKEGIEYPALKSYYYGEAFEHMTKEDWKKVKEGPVGKRLDQEHHKLVTAEKARFMEKLTGASS